MMTYEELLELDPDLANNIANFGHYTCDYCERGEHANCAGWGGKYGDKCACKREDHNFSQARQKSFLYGIERLKAYT